MTPSPAGRGAASSLRASAPRGRPGRRCVLLALVLLPALLAARAEAAAGRWQALREAVLEGYDRGSPPPPPPGVEGASPVTVFLSLNFHRIFEVDVVTSEVDLVVWIREQWNDTRLAWDPAAYNGTEKVGFWIGDGSGMSETSEIWTPDLELWNLAESVQTSFANTFANVKSDGSVFWSRPGHLRPVCKFEGLDAFPFDELTCKVEIGSWMFSSVLIDLRPAPDTDGVSMGGSDTAGESYSEFAFKSVDAYRKEYPPFVADPYPWPVVIYDIRFERSWEPYVRGYLLSQILLNIIGFACFWMPPQSGERLGLAITSMLAAIAADLVIASSLPAASEVTWLQSFSMFSMLYTTFCVLESVVVTYFHFCVCDTLTPLMVAWAARLGRAGRKPAEPAPGFHLGAGGSRSYNASPSRSSDSPSVTARDADDFRTEQERLNNARWQAVGEAVDELSRWCVTLSYVVVLAVFLGVGI